MSFVCVCVCVCVCVGVVGGRSTQDECTDHVLRRACTSKDAGDANPNPKAGGVRNAPAPPGSTAQHHAPGPPTNPSVFYSLFTLLHFLLDLGYARQLHFRFSVLEGPKHGVCMCVFPLRAHTGFAVLFNFVFIVETQPSPKEESQEL